VSDGSAVIVTDAGEATGRGRLAELYARHAGAAGRLAYLLTGDRVLAEDLVHEAFVRIIGRFHDLRNPSSFDWYLRRTVINLANSHFRRRRVERAYIEHQSGRNGSPGGVDIEAREDMWRRLHRLPDRQRTALVLRFYEDLSEERTADLMGCPVNTVKSLAARGLARLREELAREGN
jgi:RNA polymerase sigma-70 factor (sigma-E family)